MDDVTPLFVAVDRLVDRLRSMPLHRMRRGPAAEGLALARELAVRAQRLEEPGRPPRVMPEVAEFTVADQVAVAGHDLAYALQRAPGGGGGAAGGGGVAEAVRLVAEAAARCGV
ncbi:hypothetical protein RKE29_17140 [Streptomyces sp. B1866]|uniref:hypothetical protein n=1 Tax=Streptomyces sp. B1866 TaxID=3075431 RepID=UPI00288FDD91|nr:hypothetical protein [Streptomyces sp. B1866]MDT3398350.1 hypothetical protein [Streptomyces sp. B1866]